HPWPAGCRRWRPRPCWRAGGACAPAAWCRDGQQTFPAAHGPHPPRTTESAMIGRITGTLIELSPPTVCLQTGGLGYEIDVPMSTLYKLPPTGQTVTLHTHLAIREDAHVLYGFATPAERAAFRALIKVSGIGARTALSVLSGLSVEDLADAVERQESGRLVKVPGIGKKT